MPRDTTRASVRTEVQPALSPSGLRIQAHPTGMSLPQGDYRPKANPDTQLIAQAFNTLSQVASEAAREQIVKERQSDLALGTQARLEAGDAADRTADTMDKSIHFIKGYDLMSGKLGASKATADLYAIYDENPDAFITQGQIQNMVANRINADLQGVDSPEMRVAYLEGMMAVEAELTAKNAKYQSVVAHAKQIDNFSAVVNQTFSVGADNKSAQDLATDKAAMRELGKMNGLTSDEINKVLVTNVGRIAVDTGRPELLDAFNIATQDTDKPDQTIPGLSTSMTYGPAIAEFKEQAERSKTAFEVKSKEVRQNAFYKAFEAETNSGLKLKMLDDAVESGLLTAEQARSDRENMAKAKNATDMSNVVNGLMLTGDFAGIDLLVDEGLLKSADRDKIIDKTNGNLISYYHKNAESNPQEAAYALRVLSNNTVGTGRKSDVLKRELNPSPDNFGAFVEAINTMNLMEVQGASGVAAVQSHISDDMRARRKLYETQINNGVPPEEAFQMARAYGSPEALELGHKMVTAKQANAISGEVSDRLSTYDPGVFSFEYEMANTAAYQEEALSFVRSAIVKSGGRMSAEDALDMYFEKFEANHVAYKPQGSDTGVWVNMPGVEQDDLQKAMDWYSDGIRAELGYGEDIGFYPEHQPGVGYVLHDTNGFLVTRNVTTADGRTIAVPVTFKSPNDLMESYHDSQFMSPEEAMAANANRYGGQRRGPHRTPEQIAAAHNERLTKRKAREDARKKVMEIAERNAKQTDEAIGERFSTSARGTRKSRRRGRGEAPVAETPAEPAAPAQEAPAPDKSMSFIANEENAQRVGFDKQSNLWKPHGSLEGGNATLAYGHKITDEEKASGVIKIGNESVRIDAGLTETQALKLLEQDTAIARDAVDSLVTVPLNANQREALTSLVYNVGISSFKKSAALRALNAGDMKTFREEAFGAKGWVNYKGHPGGLKARRKREEDKFFGK